MAEKKKIKAQPVTPPALPPSSDSPMDPRLLEQLVKLMSEHGLSEINVREGSKRVSLKRGFAAPVSTVHAPVYAPAPTASPTPAATSKADDNAGLVPIKSPMVGTFYSASGPDAKAFVNVGSVVDEDSDVCIIEAMKVFNNIKAETRGTIAKVCVTNGQAVEFGTVLFLVKP
jgi:acetyl-CoA carboxylase biotin carboxyl carrier protein